MEPDVEQQAQGERLLRHFLESGYFRRDDDGEVRLVLGADEPDVWAVCNRRGHVVPAVEDYLSAIAHLPAS